MGIAQNGLPISGGAQARMQVPDSCSALPSDVTLAHSNDKDSVLNAECESGSVLNAVCVCVCVCVSCVCVFVYYLLPPLDNCVR